MQSKALRWCTLILGVLVIICGIWLMFTPFQTYWMITWFIPIAILCHGIGCFFDYFAAKEERPVSGWLLADGIISVIIGIWLLSRPGMTAVSLPFVFGFWVMFAGVLRLISTFTVKGGIGKRIWIFILGIIGILTGIFLINHPILSGVALTYLVSWAFVLMGIQNIVLFFRPPLPIVEVTATDGSTTS